MLNDHSLKYSHSICQWTNFIFYYEIMDYNELNDFLKNLEVKEEKIQNIYSDKIKREFNTIEGNNNSLFTDNRINSMLISITIIFFLFKKIPAIPIEKIIAPKVK